MGENRIKMICCDLDGTLLDRTQRISKGNLAAVRLAQEKGIFVTICSGRIPSMLQLFARELKIDGPLIACNGALITHAVTGEIIEGVPMEPKDVDRLLAFCRKEELDHSVLTLGVSYFSKNSRRVQRFLSYNACAAEVGVSGIPIAYFEDEPEGHFRETVYKVLVNRLKPHDLEKVAHFVENHTGLHHTSSDDGLLDISAMGVSKGAGVLRLANHLGIKPGEVCVFGDWDNDISMFEVAGMTVAMENGCDKLKALATHQTKSHEDDGVAYGIRNFILGGNGTKVE